MWSSTLHIHKNILSCQCHIQFFSENCFYDSCKLKYKDNELNVKVMQGDVLQRQLKISIPGNLFKPFSFTATLSKSDQENELKTAECSLIRTITDNRLNLSLTFRLEISDISSLDSKPLSLETLKCFTFSTINPKDSYYILCAFCDTPISNEPLSFNKVIECNEGLESELSENWFCHGTPDNSIAPQEQSLFVDQVSFYLPITISDLLSFHEDCEYACRKCKATLCIVNANLLRFYSDAIIFKTSIQTKVNLEEYRFKMGLRCLWSILKSNISSCNKIYLQAKFEESCTSLLLWIPSKVIDQFHSSSSEDNIVTSMDLKTKPVFKVLYHYSNSVSKHVKAWRHDFSVDFHKISYISLSAIFGYLKNSSKYIPGGETKVDGFAHGCLPACLCYDEF